MNLLALETSCDETAVSLLKINEGKKSFKILSSVVSSQIKIHSPWGGVVPMLAAREHLKNILPVIKKALKEAQLSFSQIDLLAVTQGPGLIPALLLGTNAMKTLAYFSDLPILGVHHIEGHICANFVNSENSGKLDNYAYPILSLIVSGGHTQLILEKSPRKYQIIGKTLDDASGEAFDKVSKILELGYPGGPIVSQKASEAPIIIENEKNPKTKLAMQKLFFPRPMLKSDNLNFSFSGLKTSVLYFYQKIIEQKISQETKEAWKIVICDQFQKAVIDVLNQKTLSAIKKTKPKTFFLSGGVSANKALRETLKESLTSNFPQISFSFPQTNLCGDNAVMIGVAGLKQYLQLKEKGQLKSLKQNWKNLVPDANLKL